MASHLRVPQGGQKVLPGQAIPTSPIIPFSEGDFKATHGTAPKCAGLNKEKPGALIFSDEMMLCHLGRVEAANLLTKAREADFGNAMIERM